MQTQTSSLFLDKGLLETAANIAIGHCHFALNCTALAFRFSFEIAD